jgi:hypothetical protein
LVALVRRWESAGTLAWFAALVVGLMLAADYGLISHILAELVSWR